MDYKYYNTLMKEERVYQSWVREKKNQILNMVDSRKKQAVWRQLFPEVTHDDSFLAGNLF